MPFIITDPCIDTKDTACVDVCPVDCIHPRKDEPEFATATMLYIHPEECIDCGACVPACPVAAIYGDFDLVLCCNLLFYYRPEVRQRILDKIVRALRPGGYCVTGAAEREIVARQTGLHAVAPPAAIFQKHK